MTALLSPAGNFGNSMGEGLLKGRDRNDSNPVVSDAQRLVAETLFGKQTRSESVTSQSDATKPPGYALLLPGWLKNTPAPASHTPPQPRESRPTAQTTAQDINKLTAQIAVHEAYESKQSYLGKFVSVFYRKDEDSLEKLNELVKKANSGEGQSDPTRREQLRADIEKQLKIDQAAIGTQEEIGHYGAGFLKTAGLFVKGRLGLASTIGFFALDQMKPSNSWQNQLEDAGWGTAKGLALRSTLTFLGKTEAGIAAKGVSMGASSRLLELGLNRETYIDTKTGERQWLSGLNKVGAAAISKDALTADVITFAVAHGAFGAANSATSGKLGKSPFWSNVLTGGTFGLSSGATGEIMRQQSAGEKLDLEKILKRGVIQGAVDAVAAAPGGLQADAGLRASLRAKLDKGVDLARPHTPLEFDRITDRLLNKLSPMEIFDRVHINPPRTERLQELGKRLGSYTSETRTHEVPVEGAKGPYKDFTDFADRALQTADRDYRVYSVTGHKAKVLVPEEFARQLDQVRQLRLEAERDTARLPESEVKRIIDARIELSNHPQKNRVLPEELLPLLDELPMRGIVKEVFLNNEANPQDPWHAQEHKRDFRSAASASSEGNITFYKQNRGPRVRENLFHEWAHLHKYLAGKLSDAFDKAALLEKDGHFSNDYSRTSDHENWAVNMGEELLHLDGDRFFMMARRTPLRSSVWGKAMQEKLDHVPVSERSPYHEQFKTRLAYLDHAITPKAVQILVNKFSTADLPSRNATLEVLSVLADASVVNRVKSMAKNPADKGLSSGGLVFAGT